MKEVVLVSGARTAVGNFLGSLKNISAAQLGAVCIRDTLQKAGLKPEVKKSMSENSPDKLDNSAPLELEKKYWDFEESKQVLAIDEVIMGNVLQAGQGQNPARQATIYSGLPKETPATTVNKVCASGMKAISLGVQAIKSGDAEAIIAGGMENMSLAPYTLPKLREGARMFNTEAKDLMVMDGLWELFYDYHMGVTAENIAELYQIGREEQDQISLDSHNRAREAINRGRLKEEISPVSIPQKKGDPLVFDTDEKPMETSMEKLGKLPPVFKKDGSVTAGNASGVNDAGAAVLLMSKEKADELGLEPLATIKSYSAGAIDPAYMGLGVIPATRLALQNSGWKIEDIDCIELNEAFAAQALACLRELGMDWNKVNPNGSGISIGHPIGCTGARIAYSLAKEMEINNYSKGLSTLCIGGGMGYAMLLERK